MPKKQKICRTCFCVGEENAEFFTLDDIQPKLKNTQAVTIKEKISVCVPELELNIVSNAVMCNTCTETLHSVYEFRNKCIEVDKKIHAYIQDTPGFTGRIDLDVIISRRCNIKTTVDDSEHGKRPHDPESLNPSEDSIADRRVQIEEAQNACSIGFSTLKLEPMDYPEDIAELQQQNDDLDNDMLEFSDEIQNNGTHFNCTACGKIYKREAGLIVHMKIHETENASDLCKPETWLSTFLVRNDTEGEIKEFLPKQSEQNDAICEVCNKSFYSKSNLTVHMRIHTGEKPFRCEICTKAFTQKVYLIAHERTHTGEKPFNCSLCEKSFAQKSYLRTHMIVHTGVRHHICKVCGKGCAHTGDLNNHMRIHTGEKPYKCEQCGKCFTQSVHLRSHVKIHTGQKPYGCTTCDARYTEKRYLRKHMRVHTGSKPFKCALCVKSFHEKYILTEHLKSHTGEKPCVCLVCKKQYSKTSHLNEHMRTHTGEKPFGCSLCGGQFTYKQSLNAHLKAHSKIDKKNNSLEVIKVEPTLCDDPLVTNGVLNLSARDEPEKDVPHNVPDIESVTNAN